MIKANLLQSYLNDNARQSLLRQLYGPDPAGQANGIRRWGRLADFFSSCFPGHDHFSLYSVPGRTEIGGNHTDHQHGRVLCASVDLDIIGIAAPNQEGVIRLQSEGFPKMDVIDLKQLEPVPEERTHSAALIRGIAAAFNHRGCRIGGFDACTTSLVPKGSGLSSSAAFEVLVATILDHLWNESRLSPVERAIIGQYAENNYFGKPSGLMDQCGCAVGGFMTIDFRIPGEPVVQPLELDFAATGHALVITNTGGSHADLTDDYAAIPRDMKAVAALFGKTVLREVPEEAFWAELPACRGQVSDQALLRAIHFFQDNQRVSWQAESLQQGDFQRFLQLVRASGTSSRNQLQNVYSAVNPDEQPVSLALSVSEMVLGDRGACRVHGGGFAGTIQAFVPLDLLDQYLETMRHHFGGHAPSAMRIRSLGATALPESR